MEGYFINERVGHMDETWVSVENWEGQYEVSDRGRVRSNARTVIKSNGVAMKLKGQVLKPQAQESGHLGVTLPDGYRHLVSRLVGKAFIPNPDSKPQILHNNGDPSDNRVENLRWGTQSENMLDRRKHGTDHEVNKTHCPQGHEYTPENTRLRGERGRQCRACSDISSRKWKDRNNKSRLEENDPRHGTIRAYQFYKCRCEPCRTAGSDYRKGWLIRNKEKGLVETDSRHGTRAGYQWGCRCRPCTIANTEYPKRVNRK